MIIEKTVAKKSLAVTLALALFTSAPMSAWSQNLAAASRAATVIALPASMVAPGAATSMARGVTPVALSNLSLNSQSFAAPAVAAPQLSLEEHSVIGILNALQAKGVQLPETLSTRADAEKLFIAAQALPEGSAKQNMIAMAAAISAANNTGSSAQLGRIWDAAMARGEAPEAAPVKTGGWSALASRLLPASLSNMVVKKESEAAPAALPANPEDFAVTVADLRFSPSAAQLPENTSAIPESNNQVVGQDGALKAIKFGLQMPGLHYNLFVSGPDGSGRETALRHMLPEVASKMPTPGDRVAVTNFRDKENPIILDLEAGRGPAFVKGVRDFVATLEFHLPQVLASAEAATKAILAQVREAAAEREAAFQSEIKAIKLAHDVFTVEFFSRPNGDGELLIGLNLVHGGKAVAPEKADALIASGAFTRAQFDAASAERDQKFPAVMEKFKAKLAQDEKELAAAQEKIAKAEKAAEQGMASIITQAAQPMEAAVATEAKDTPERAALRAKFKSWSADFNARVSAVDVEGFGIVILQSGTKITVAYTKDGAPLTKAKVAELTKQGLAPEKFAEIKAALTAAAGPLISEFLAKDKEFFLAQEELAKNQPQPTLTPEQLKAAGYVKTLLKFATENNVIFMGKIATPPHAEGIKDVPGQKPLDAQDFFEASVLSTNRGKKGAPVVWVKNPTLDKVFGMADDNRRRLIIEGVGMAKGGAPGGPTLIGGAIQQAEGGFLVMDLMDVLRAPGLYQALMAAARSGTAAMVEGGLQSLMNGKDDAHHVSSKVKIVLTGSPSLRMLVEQQDRDFALNFQASAAFESSLKVSEEAVAGYVQFFKKAVLSLAAELKQDVTNLTQDAMMALVEHGARLVDSNKKLTAQFGAMYGVVREATYWAREAGRTEVRREDVDTALQTKQDRDEVYRHHLLQVYKDNVFVVETTGKKVGQINGLAVMGNFGVPKRITVVPYAAAGGGGVISVDRRAGPDQTGPSFNKALGIVEGFLQNLFAQKRAFPAGLSISYEQSYGGIDGDSATSTEMYSILSALSGVAIGQNFAVTGSADQYGNVQAIGGANHKIEGFFELCKARGLTGDQGIVIPLANVADLQLSHEVVQAVKDGKFHIYAVSHVSQGLEILTGVAYAEILSKARAKLAQMGKPEAKSKN